MTEFTQATNLITENGEVVDQQDSYDKLTVVRERVYD